MNKAAKIKDKLAKKGQSGTLLHVVSAADAAAPQRAQVSSDTEEITFVMLPISPAKDISHLFPTATIREAVHAYIAAYGLRNDPVRGDVITDAGNDKWTVASSSRLAPAGLELLWEAILYR